MNYIILTGASRGIGLATARKLLKGKNKIFCISRSENKKLVQESKTKMAEIVYKKFDLSNTGKISSLIKDIFDNIDVNKADSIHLINNAGMLEPVKPIEKCSIEELDKNISVNLVAPMSLISKFLNKTSEIDIDKRIINISSGAARHPYSGWGCYCTSKAGINMLTDVVAREQENAKYPAKVVSFAPGVVATDMQKSIRKKNREEFPRVEKFINLKKNNELLSPEEPATAIRKLLFSKDLVNGAIMDIRDK